MFDGGALVRGCGLALACQRTRCLMVFSSPETMLLITDLLFLRKYKVLETLINEEDNAMR
jgi:hypothetical protein